MKRVCDMTSEEFKAHCDEQVRIRELAENDPDKLTIDDLLNLQSGDEYWTELALGIACDRLRTLAGAALALANATCDVRRDIEAIQVASAPKRPFARMWAVLKATIRHSFTTTVIRSGAKQTPP